MAYSLFEDTEIPCKNKFPSTRYQGSKAKFADWIWYELSKIEFHSMLDAFGGTGSIAYKMKDNGKSVAYNDILPFNSIIGKALIENSFNSFERLMPEDIDFILTEHATITYPTFIADNFKDIYYTDEENHWLDVIRYNISQLENEYKRALAWFALFQACIIKRPYNLFHRKNLYVRMSEIERSFGNKKTWDTPFETHFRTFVKEANQAVFDNGERCVSFNSDALELENNYDLIYIDTPYLNDKGVGVDYADFYHFLNGLVNYETWEQLIDYKSKHLRLRREYSIWNDKSHIVEGFERLIDHFQQSILAFSYRSNGIPSIDEILSLLNQRGRRTTVHYSRDIKYALSDTKSKEVLIVSHPN